MGNVTSVQVIHRTRQSRARDIPHQTNDGGARLIDRSHQYQSTAISNMWGGVGDTDGTRGRGTGQKLCCENAKSTGWGLGGALMRAPPSKLPGSAPESIVSCAAR
jgi:hypothetical protein